jgi:hypothetical protein
LLAPEDNQYEDDFDRVMSVNAKGSFPRLKYEIAHMSRMAAVLVE